MRALKTLLLIKLKVVPVPIRLEEVNNSNLVAKVIQCISNHTTNYGVLTQTNEYNLNTDLTIAVVFAFEEIAKN